MVHVEGWRTAYRGIVSAAYLGGLSHEQSERTWRDYLLQRDNNTFAYVADESTAKCIGFVAGGPEHTVQSGYRGELYALYVLADYHHKGIGRKLVSRSVEMFLAQGMDSMLVWVLVGNPFCSFYRALGGHPVGKRVTTIDGRELAEIAYGWRDLQIPELGLRGK